MSRERFLLVVGMIFVAAMLRVLPHPPNFTPIAAIALFGGAVLSDKRWAVGVPLLIMFLSDWVIGFHRLAPLIYLSFVVMVFMGTFLGERKRILPVGFVAVGASIFFFVVSNFGVWAFGGLYPHTLDGLVACYVAALPFFQNTVLGTLFYSVLLFGGLRLLEKGVPRFRALATSP
jgi:hypothetical protein